MMTRRADRARVGRRRRAAAAGAAAVTFLALAGAVSPVSAAWARPVGQDRASATEFRVGRLLLRRCETTPRAFCGHVLVPLDYASADSPRIRIGFRWIPATGHPAGTVLAVEGGPGYASTGTQFSYLAMLGPLRQSRNLLMVDLRGTGSSTPVNCPGLEHFAGIGQDGARFNRQVAACGRRLNHTWRYRGGGWVHASDLFNTAYSARDVSGVLRDLQLGRVDLYGDSYGSWFSQAFASRYPGQLRSVTLDSTYQVLDLDPWYVTTVVTARRAFDEACLRWPACSREAKGPGYGWAEITALARRLRVAPVSGQTAMANGTTGKLTVTVRTLVNLVNNAGFDPVVYRDLDAAARALLSHGDPVPLLRVAALSLGFDDTNYPLPEFSDGLYFAVACTDYVQLFGRSAAPEVRHREYLRALAREPAGIFAPFTVGQWTGMDQYTEAYSACLNWPTPSRLVPPITRRPPLVPAGLPVLVMSGDLDSLTPRLHGATLVARQMGRSARLVVFANLTHVMLQDDNDACPASVFQRFLLDPGGLASENVSCAARVTPVHAVGAYPLRLAGARPATPRPGNTAGRQALRAVTVALASVGDEVSRFGELGGTRDLGLRGGTVTFRRGRVLTITLRGVRWVTDAAVDGRAWWDRKTGWVTASLTVRLARGAPVRLRARWLAYAAPGQIVVVTGRQAGTRIVAVAPAP
ncbi:MAG TPA: alpha/beta hydrolase [Streptosporangiaceae bacterium]|nr:alpha/beta hydrolase [Streptosporangiaceae bacterium]